MEKRVQGTQGYHHNGNKTFIIKPPAIPSQEATIKTLQKLFDTAVKEFPSRSQKLERLNKFLHSAREFFTLEELEKEKIYEFCKTYLDLQDTYSVFAKGKIHASVENYLTQGIDIRSSVVEWDEKLSGMSSEKLQESIALATHIIDQSSFLLETSPNADSFRRSAPSIVSMIEKYIKEEKLARDKVNKSGEKRKESDMWDDASYSQDILDDFDDDEAVKKAKSIHKEARDYSS
jgi:hypothetical protein